MTKQNRSTFPVCLFHHSTKCISLLLTDWIFLHSNKLCPSFQLRFEQLTISIHFSWCSFLIFYSCENFIIFSIISIIILKSQATHSFHSISYDERESHKFSRLVSFVEIIEVKNILNHIFKSGKFICSFQNNQEIKKFSDVDKGTAKST